MNIHLQQHEVVRVTVYPNYATIFIFKNKDVDALKPSYPSIFL